MKGSWLAVTRRATAAIFASAVVTACSAIGASGPSAKAPGPSSTGTTPASPSPGCANILVTVQWWPMTMANLAQASSVIVAGTFLGYGQAAWNTPSGAAPATVSDSSPAHLVRAAQIDTSQVLRGSAAAVASARVDGGDLGCVHYRYDDALALQPNLRYVFFFQPAMDSASNPLSSLWLYQAWPLSPADVIQTTLEGAVPLSDLVRVIAANPVLIPPPSS